MPPELLPDDLLPDELPPDESSSESPDPELPEPEESSESSSESSSEPEPEPPDEGSVVGVVGSVVGWVVGCVVGAGVVGSVVGLVVVVDPVDPVPAPEPPDVVALPDVVPPAGLDPEVTGPMNTPSTPSCVSGLQLSEPLRSSAEICEQVTVSIEPGVAATATPCGRKPAALMTMATATGRHTFCPNICGGPPDDLVLARVDDDACTT